MSIWISSGCLTLEKTNRNGRSRLIFGCRPRPLGQMLAREPLEHTQYHETLIKAFSTPLIKRQDLLTRVDSCLFFYHWQYVSIKHHCPKYLLASLPQIFVKGLNSFKCVLLHLIYSCSWKCTIQCWLEQPPIHISYFVLRFGRFHDDLSLTSKICFRKENTLCINMLQKQSYIMKPFHWPTHQQLVPQTFVK